MIVSSEKEKSGGVGMSTRAAVRFFEQLWEALA
jgi:hypothetical protein